MAKHFIDRLRAELDTLYNGSDTFVLALLDGSQASYIFTATLPGTFTATGHNFVNGVRVQLSNSGGALPTGTASGTTYYVVNAAPNTYQLATTRGGNPLTITDAGSGTNTVTEQPLDETDDQTSILVRHEVNYYGATPRPTYNPDAAIADYPNRAAYLAQKGVTFSPNQGSITFRYSLLIRNGNATPGDSTGIPDNLQDHGITQTILNNTTKGIEVYILRKDLAS